MQILNCFQLDIKEVAHLAVFVGGVADAVELQVGVAQAGFGGLPAELGAAWTLEYPTSLA